MAQLYEWFTVNRLSINLDKTCYSIFGPNHKELEWRGYKVMKKFKDMFTQHSRRMDRQTDRRPTSLNVPSVGHGIITLRQITECAEWTHTIYRQMVLSPNFDLFGAINAKPECTYIIKLPYISFLPID